MKTLIVYTTKQGTTLKCTKIIASKSDNAEIVEIRDMKNKNLELYDLIFIGTPVYFGRINKRIQKFIQQNKDLLLQKELKIFTTGMDDKSIIETHKRNFDDDIRNHAVIKYVGGSYQFEKLNWLERLIVKRISTVNESIENIKEDKIKELLNEHKL